MLNPKNKHVQYSWRFDPVELGVKVDVLRRKQLPRTPLVECGDSDEEYCATDNEAWEEGPV